MDEQKNKLGIFAGMTSAASRRKSVEVFGKALTPQQAVKKIVHDIRNKGDKALFAYTKKLDGEAINARNITVADDGLATGGSSGPNYDVRPKAGWYTRPTKRRIIPTPPDPGQCQSERSSSRKAHRRQPPPL